MEGAARAVTTVPVTRCGALDGTAVHRIDLSGGDLEVSILTWGATIQRLRVHGPSAQAPRGPRDVVLGFDTCEEYLAHRLYMGCVAGRFANRIAAGRFPLDGTTYQVSRNENGVNHLHGGFEGFSRKVWSIDAVTQSALDLVLVSRDGEEGYPGTLTARCRYSIEDGRTLRIALSAVTDAPTIVNLATHSYFNLFRSVGGTPFDFRTRRDLRPPDMPVQRYDNTYVLAPSEGDIRQAARLENTSVALEIWSTEPGIQFFDGGTMRSMPGRAGVMYGPYSGLCLEPQRFPDSPNQSGFTDCTLRPGETYRQTTEYRFEVA